MDIDDLTKRHHIEPEYLKKLGFAFYSFCSAESNAIWCCDRLVNGFAAKWTQKDWAQVKKLATKLQHEAGKVIKLRDNENYRSNLREIISHSKRLYSLADNNRNKLFHALPIGDNGKTILYKSGTTFNEDELEKFIEEALEVRSFFNRAYHGFLAEYFGDNGHA